MGHLFILDTFKGFGIYGENHLIKKKLEPFELDRKARILEVGAGLSMILYKTLGFKDGKQSVEYWIADEAGFYDAEDYEKAREKRSEAKIVDTLLGKYSSELSNDYFDLVLSVSVIEHVPPENLKDVIADIYRVLRPGGVMLHSLDCRKNRPEFGEQFGRHTEEVGFKWIEGP